MNAAATTRKRQEGAGFSLGHSRGRVRTVRSLPQPTRPARANPRSPERRDPRSQGVALIMVLTVIAMISVFVVSISTRGESPFS